MQPANSGNQQKMLHPHQIFGGAPNQYITTVQIKASPQHQMTTQRPTQQNMVYLQTNFHQPQIQQPLPVYTPTLQQTDFQLQNMQQPAYSMISPPMETKPGPPWLQNGQQQPERPQSYFAMSSYLADDRATPAPIPIECQLGPDTPSPSLPSNSPTYDTEDLFRMSFSDEIPFEELMSVNGDQERPIIRRNRRTKAQIIADRNKKLTSTLKDCFIPLRPVSVEQKDCPVRIFSGANVVLIRKDLPRVPRMKMSSGKFHKIASMGFIKTAKGLAFGCIRQSCSFKTYDKKYFVLHLRQFHEAVDSIKICALCQQPISGETLMEELRHMLVHIIGPRHDNFPHLPTHFILRSTIKGRLNDTADDESQDDECNESEDENPPDAEPSHDKDCKDKDTEGSPDDSPGVEPKENDVAATVKDEPNDRSVSPALSVKTVINSDELSSEDSNDDFMLDEKIDFNDFVDFLEEVQDIIEEAEPPCDCDADAPSNAEPTSSEEPTLKEEPTLNAVADVMVEMPEAKNEPTDDPDFEPEKEIESEEEAIQDDAVTSNEDSSGSEDFINDDDLTDVEYQEGDSADSDPFTPRHIKMRNKQELKKHSRRVARSERKEKNAGKVSAKRASRRKTLDNDSPARNTRHNAVNDAPPAMSAGKRRLTLAKQKMKKETEARKSDEGVATRKLKRRRLPSTDSSDSDDERHERTSRVKRKLQDVESSESAVDDIPLLQLKFTKSKVDTNSTPEASQSSDQPIATSAKQIIRICDSSLSLSEDSPMPQASEPPTGSAEPPTESNQAENPTEVPTSATFAQEHESQEGASKKGDFSVWMPLATLDKIKSSKTQAKQCAASFTRHDLQEILSNIRLDTSSPDPLAAQSFLASEIVVPARAYSLQTPTHSAFSKSPLPARSTSLQDPIPSTSKAPFPSTSKASFPFTSKLTFPSTSKLVTSSTSNLPDFSKNDASIASTSDAPIPSTSKSPPKIQILEDVMFKPKKADKLTARKSTSRSDKKQKKLTARKSTSKAWRYYETEKAEDESKECSVLVKKVSTDYSSYGFEAPVAVTPHKEASTASTQDVGEIEIAPLPDLDDVNLPPVPVKDFPSVLNMTLSSPEKVTNGHADADTDADGDVFLDALDVVAEADSANTPQAVPSDSQTPMEVENDSDELEMTNGSPPFTYLAKLYPWIADDIVGKYQKSVGSAKVLLEDKCLFSTYKCMSIECSFFTTDIAKFKTHVNKHIEVDVNFLCSYCLVDEKTPEDLIIHLGETHKFDRYQCSKCMYRACEKFYVNDHLTQEHKDEKASILKSPMQMLTNGQRKQAKAKLEKNKAELMAKGTVKCKCE